jgi:MoxR-like ATPase
MMGVTTRALEQAAAALRSAIAAASRGLIEREVLVELVALAAVAGEHVLIIGPPGTAKSEAVRRIARRLEGRYFEYLLGRFTEPSEIFGPVSLAKLKNGIVETETAGMLPEAEIAFLDEVFLGSTAILNTLLGILNERTFRRGHTHMTCPLRVCVGASNRLPEDEQLAAFADRFLVRTFVTAVGDSRIEELLEGSWALGAEMGPPAGGALATIGNIDALSRAARGADVAGVRSVIAHALRTLRSAGVELSDRRAARVQRLVAAAAVLAGRSKPSEADLWPIIFAVPTEAMQRVARDALRDLLARAENAALPAAAAEGSLGPLARAARIVTEGNALLERGDQGDEMRYWLELEAVAREIDAGFAPDALTPDLAALRERLVTMLRELPKPPSSKRGATLALGSPPSTTTTTPSS